MKFRKKPVEIEAIRARTILKQVELNFSLLPEWVQKAWNDGTLRPHDGLLEIVTLEGVMTANRDDWVIQGVKGELYACKPDIFDATYDHAD